MTLQIPAQLQDSCRGDAARTSWLDALPDLVDTVAHRWTLSVGPPFLEHTGSCAWVAPVTTGDGVSAVLKLALPHMEGAHEIAGLRFWNGDGTVRLLDADEAVGALLLERCRPGTSLRTLSEPQQDRVLGELLPRLWRSPSPQHAFRPLGEMLECWAREVRSELDRRTDPELAAAGIEVYSQLMSEQKDPVVLFTDLHAGNVLRSEREPWLAIDPKPFVGDAAFDATQHLLNCPQRMLQEPFATIASFSDRLGVSRERVRLWMYARVATSQREIQGRGGWETVARTLAP